MFELRFFEIYRSLEYMNLLMEGILISTGLTITAGIAWFFFAFLFAVLRYWKVFIFGFIFKLTLVITAVPDIHIQWFIPFVSNSLTNFSADPWTSYLTSGGDSIAFPYGFSMLLAYMPLSGIGLLIDNLKAL